MEIRYNAICFTSYFRGLLADTIKASAWEWMRACSKLCLVLIGSSYQLSPLVPNVALPCQIPATFLRLILCMNVHGSSCAWGKTALNASRVAAVKSIVVISGAFPPSQTMFISYLLPNDMIQLSYHRYACVSNSGRVKLCSADDIDTHDIDIRHVAFDAP